MDIHFWWSKIASHWNTHIKKKLKKMGIDPVTHKPLLTATADQLPQEQQSKNELVQQVQQEPIPSNSAATSEMDQNKEVENETVKDKDMQSTDKDMQQPSTIILHDTQQSKVKIDPL